MAFYAISTIPLIDKLKQDVLQVWYANDAAGAGNLSPLCLWWDKISDLGPAFGYFLNASKSHLLVKQHFMDQARDIFKGTNLSIITEGKEHLGGFIRHEPFLREYITKCVQEGISSIEVRSKVRLCHPQAALTVLTRGMASKWIYLMRVTSDDNSSWNTLESALCHKFLPALTGQQAFSDQERELLSLPAKLGGIGAVNLSQMSKSQYNASRKVSSPLINSIQNLTSEDPRQVCLPEKSKKRGTEFQSAKDH
jgi:hypothetical protein